MQRDELIQLARNYGVEIFPSMAPDEALLVAFKLGEIIEREACAALCDAKASEYLAGNPRRQHRHGAGLGASICADAIRARPSTSAPKASDAVAHHSV